MSNKEISRQGNCDDDHILLLTYAEDERKGIKPLIIPKVYLHYFNTLSYCQTLHISYCCYGNTDENSRQKAFLNEKPQTVDPNLT